MKNEHKKSPREATTSTKGNGKIIHLNYNKKEEKKQPITCDICGRDITNKSRCYRNGQVLCMSDFLTKEELSQ